MSFLQDIGGIVNNVANYDLKKREINASNNEANATPPTQNTTALDSRVNAQAIQSKSIDSKTLLIGGGVLAGVVLLILIVKK